ncbi:MAG: protease pro-enzyme activation domain-containing protein [Solirubrobacteraceae bacterium]
MGVRSTWISLGVAGAICLSGAAPPALAQGLAAHAVRLGAAPPAQQLQILLPLRGRDTALGRFAQDVSSPGSPQYGHYEPIPALARRFGALAQTRSAVMRYLRSRGARAVRVDSTALFVHATMSVAAAERTFAAPLAAFASDAGRFVAPVSRVRIPRGLRGLIEGVVGLDTRPVVSRPPRRDWRGTGSPAMHGAFASQPSSGYFPATGSPSGCAAGVNSGGFTPNEYLRAYDYAPLRSAGLRGMGERVALIEIDGFRYSDLKTYARCFHLDIPALTTFALGLKHPLAPGAEATLDLEVLDAVAPDLARLEVFETRGDTASVLKAFLAPVLYPNAKPQIISTSIGLCERFIRRGDPGAIRSAERTYQLLAAAGVTVVAAAGDQGSADCSSPSPYQPARDRRLAVDFPASSPWVTGVGGTQLRLDASNHIQQQLVWNDTNQIPDSAGGGGLSHLFARPSYQKGVVGSDRRAVPDVSALADPSPGYAVFCSAAECRSISPWSTVGGTSAAAPLLAGGVALVDQDLHRHGQELMGFMNPLLYQLGKSNSGVFRDVLAYGNDVGRFMPGGGHPLGCCTAKAGFDLASGWGSTDLEALDSAARSMLPKIPDLLLSIPGGQRPVSQHRIITALRCSASCTALAFALVAVKGTRVFEVSADPRTLKANTSSRVALRFSKRQERRLRDALAHGRKIFAEAFGALSDAKGDILELTPAKRVRISG